MSLYLRKSSLDDLALVFLWANDPLTRSMSFHSEPITLATHTEWFKKQLTNSKSHLLILMDSQDNVPIGQIKIDSDGIIGISIATAYRGKGYSSAGLMITSIYAKKYFSFSILTAYIRKDNIASIKAFEKAGYIYIGEYTINNVLCNHYIKEL